MQAMSAWHITAKDLYLLLRDRRTFAVLLLLPLVFIVIIGLTTGKFLGWRSTNQQLKIVAVDETDYEEIGSAEFVNPPDAPPDDSGLEPLSPEERDAHRRVAGHIVANVLNDIQRAGGIEVRTVAGWHAHLKFPPPSKDTVAAARELVANGSVNAAVIFTPEFYHRVYHLDLVDLAARQDDDPLPTEKLRRMGVELVTERPDSSAASAIAAIVGYQLRDVIEPIVGCRSERARTATIAERGSPQYRRLCGPVNAMQTTQPPALLPPQQEAGTVSNTVYEELVPSYTVMFVFFLVNIMA